MCKYLSAIEGPNQRVYCCPFNQRSILEITPVSDTLRRIDVDYYEHMCTGAVKQPSGTICFLPARGTLLTLHVSDVEWVGELTADDVMPELESGLHSKSDPWFLLTHTVRQWNMNDSKRWTVYDGFEAPSDSAILPLMVFCWAQGCIGSDGNVYHCPYDVDCSIVLGSSNMDGRTVITRIDERPDDDIDDKTGHTIDYDLWGP